MAYHELKQELERSEKSFIEGRYEDISPWFKNTSRNPSGGTLYGILFNQSKPAVGPFNIDVDNSKMSREIRLKNVKIHSLKLNGIERVAL